jgi:hypothetical protein
MKSFHFVAMILYAVSVFGETRLETPSTSSVFIHVNVATAAAERLVGSGIALPNGSASRPAAAKSGGAIVWKESRSATDPQGGRHVAFRQHLVTPANDAELYGSEVILHYGEADVLWAIAGTQFDSITVTNTPRFTALEAVDRALQKLASNPQFTPSHPVNMLPAARMHRALRTNLKVVQKGSEFRYAYFTFANDAKGIYHHIVIDAESEAILGISEVNPRSNCHPTPGGTPYQAWGIPVRPDVSVRILSATTASDRPAPFDHEAFWNTGIRMSIVQDTLNIPFMCNYDPQNPTRRYTLFPLVKEAGIIEFKDRPAPERPDEPWAGSAAGDALHHTQTTMSVFNYLGRNGWDGVGGDANVVIQSTYEGGVDQAFFVIDPGGSNVLPPTPTLGITRAAALYNHAASLDGIAHEWGHGMIFRTAGIQPTSPEYQQLHEGLADVIGHIGEKYGQPDGSGVEQSSDWRIQEDSTLGSYFRSGQEDDGACHDVYGPGGYFGCINNLMHKDDLPTTAQMHAVGNMLSVVFKLLANGGGNPVCDRLPGLSGCGVTTTAQGLTKATRMFFDAIQFYIPSTAAWQHMPGYVNLAAFANYRFCPNYAATNEQHAVDRAFTAIGYPRLSEELTCSEF